MTSLRRLIVSFRRQRLQDRPTTDLLTYRPTYRPADLPAYIQNDLRPTDPPTDLRPEKLISYADSHICAWNLHQFEPATSNLFCPPAHPSLHPPLAVHPLVFQTHDDDDDDYCTTSYVTFDGEMNVFEQRSRHFFLTLRLWDIRNLTPDLFPFSGDVGQCASSRF